MTITFSKKTVPEQPNSGIMSSNPNLNRYGAWGIVRDVYSADHSADVLIDGGALLSRVPVFSREWVCPGDEYVSGGRNLPPSGARVFVLMPTGNFDGCFVLCSGFVAADKAQEEVFLEAEKERTEKRVTPGNWKEESLYATGTIEIVSPDGKTGIKIDYGTEDEPKDAPELSLSVFDELHIRHKEGDSVAVSVFEEVEIEHVKGDSCTIKAFDTELVIKQGGDIEIRTSGKTTIESDSDITVKGANVNVEALAAATVKAAQARITGGVLRVDGTAAPGSGPFCALPACLVTGTPHTGNIVSGT